VGDKRHLVELSKKNALAFQQELKKKAILNIQQATADEHITVLKQMRDDLQLPMVPMHIECFDNSNFQGSYPVAAMVCFKKGVPSKQDYRHFHIKTVTGINDFASMSEIVYRRYKRLMDEAAPLPDLVIIDGGKGQLGAALESLEKLGLMGKLTIVGLAKREESIFFPGDSEPIQLPYDSPPHLLIRRIRDEVHRFGITFHRKVRSEGTIKNDLETIPGIGAQTATTLLKAFRSVKHIKTLTERELTAVIGASKARIVYNHFKEVQEDI
jgi:excinuclease ABC subunit C